MSRPSWTRRRAIAWALAPWAGAASAASPDGELVQHPWPPRRPTPPLVLPRWQGAPWTLAAQRGRPVLLNFWASWCEPCRAEMPALEALARRHQAEGLQVMAVNFREQDAAVARFLEHTPLSLPVLLDRSGDAARAFGVRIFPSTAAIDRRGHVLSVAVGEYDWSAEPARRWLSAVL